MEYFNAGVAQDRTAGAATTLDARFTNPRGPGFPTGLGLTEQQVSDIAEFLENGLYDPAFVKYDPQSGTDTFQPNERDLTYSKYHLDLAALGAKDGLMPSGLAIDDNDPLARRDQGLEFLDVTAQIEVKKGQSLQANRSRIDPLRLTNTGPAAVDTHLLVVVRGLPANVSLQNASGTYESRRTVYSDVPKGWDHAAGHQCSPTADLYGSGRQSSSAVVLYFGIPVGTWPALTGGSQFQSELCLRRPPGRLVSFFPHQQIRTESLLRASQDRG